MKKNLYDHIPTETEPFINYLNNGMIIRKYLEEVFYKLSQNVEGTSFSGLFQLTSEDRIMETVTHSDRQKVYQLVDNFMEKNMNSREMSAFFDGLEESMSIIFDEMNNEMLLENHNLKQKIAEVERKLENANNILYD